MRARLHARLDLVGGREQVALGVALGVVGQPEAVGLLQRPVPGLLGVVGVLGERRDDLGEPEALGDRDGREPDEVVGVDEDLEGVGCLHLLLELVGTDLDAGRVRLAGGRVDEGLDRLGDAVGLEVATDLGGRVALVDGELDRAPARARVVVGALELVGDPRDALGQRDVEAADEHHERDQHREAALEAASLAALAARDVVVLQLLALVRTHVVRTGLVLTHLSPSPRRSLPVRVHSTAPCPVQSAGSARPLPDRRRRAAWPRGGPARAGSTRRTPWSVVHHTA